MISEERDLAVLSLRQIGELIGEQHPQKIKHHLEQLKKKRLINLSKTRELYKLRKNLYKKTLNLIEIPILGTANSGINLVNKIKKNK